MPSGHALPVGPIDYTFARLESLHPCRGRAAYEAHGAVGGSVRIEVGPGEKTAGSSRRVRSPPGRRADWRCRGQVRTGRVGGPESGRRCPVFGSNRAGCRCGRRVRGERRAGGRVFARRASIRADRAALQRPISVRQVSKQAGMPCRGEVRKSTRATWSPTAHR